jgi:hypothetical protein
MLVHYFWLFEFKFVFEFICLSPFFKLFEPLFLFPSSYPFWPDFSCSPSAQSPPVHLFFFGLVHRVVAQLGSAAQPAQPQQRRQPTTPPLSPAAADKRDPLVVPFLPVVPVSDSSPSPRRARACAFLAWPARLGTWPVYLRSPPPPEASCHPNPSRPKPCAPSPKP